MFGRMNAAILGTGNMAERMAYTLRRMKGVEAYAVASRNAEQASEFAKRNGIRKSFGSYEDLLKDKKVNLVYIATPHSEHYANAKLCLEHGKAALVEKPFTVNEKQAEELFKLAEEKHVFIAEAMWTRYMPFCSVIREVLDSKIIGDPVMMDANFSHNNRALTRLTEPELAGGALLDLGVYPISFALLTFGPDILRINATCTYTEKHLDEQGNYILVYRDGKMASLQSSFLGTSDCSGMIAGSKGYMVIDNLCNYQSLKVFDNSGRKIDEKKRPKQITGYEYEIEACLKAIKGGRIECAEYTHEDTLTLLHITDEIRRQFGIVYPFENEEILTENESEPVPGEIPEEGTDEAAEEMNEPVFETSVESCSDTGAEEASGIAQEMPAETEDIATF